MGDHKTVRYMDETERQILVKLCGKDDASEAEVTGLEYWDEAGNMTTWKTCTAPRFLIVVSHLVHGGVQSIVCEVTPTPSSPLNKRSPNFEMFRSLPFRQLRRGNGECGQRIED
jgi:hypothetical protein